MSELKRTALWDLHQEYGAKMVGFAGYDMPVQYKLGVMGEHLHTRSQAGLFDVSHMGQVLVHPKSGQVSDAALAMERLVPVDLVDLKPGRQRYAFFTNEAGGIDDDLMIANRKDHLFVVVNAACKDADIAYMKQQLSGDCDVVAVTDRALIALQGPEAERVIGGLNHTAPFMKFMDVATMMLGGAKCWVSRSGYSGEDGYEISVPNGLAVQLVRDLIAQGGVEMIGLGARDSLRLEAGLCLYGNDLDATTSPVEANLRWAMQKARRAGGEREGGFPGAARILAELADGPKRLRVGLLPDGRAPMRAGVELFANETDAEPIGSVTSGAFGPSIERPMSMGYVSVEHATTGTRIWGDVRGKRLPVTVADMPFRPSTYKR